MRKCHLLTTFVLSSITLFSPLLAEEEASAFYPNPGIVAQRGGGWVGSDHLYNLTDHISIVTEIFKPEKLTLSITEKQIHDQVADEFKKGGITPDATNKPGQPLLPFFHLLVMIYPIEKGYVVYCEGRLFEKINLERVRLDDLTAMQGITWESQNLIITPKDDLETHLDKSVDEIVKTFVERFRFYKDIKSQIKKN